MFQLDSDYRPNCAFKGLEYSRVKNRKCYSNGWVGTDLSDNNWHHIAYTYEYDASTTYYTTKIYVDGNSTPVRQQCN